MDSKTQELIDIISKGETLKVEFKSDLKQLPDRELIATAMSLSNSEGGDLLLGVEDDGSITGVHSNHLNMMGIVALIANKTSPSVSVKIETYDIGDKKVARIRVPKGRQLVSTSDGLLQRRRLMANGKPEAVPFYPHEFIQRQSALGLMDPSAMPILELGVKDLNPLERQRIREAVNLYRGDSALLSLTDEELDGALGLICEVDGVQHPTLAGLLMMGREEDLRKYVPSHEVAFQVLEGTDVRMNEFFRKPLLQVFEEVWWSPKTRLVYFECLFDNKQTKFLENRMARKYKSHTPSVKVKVALEAAGNQKTTNQIASEYMVSPSQVTEWKGQLIDEAENFFQGKRRRKTVEMHEDVEYLQQQIGKLTTQIEWLKKKQRMES